MARVFITGSADGLGRLAAETLLEAGHQVVLHARTRTRLDAVRAAMERGAQAAVGDLAVEAQVRDLAARVDELGPLDAVIHNAGVLNGPSLLAVNVVAPYLLTALMRRPRRLIYLSSSMHRTGRARLRGVSENGHDASLTYSDTKLLVTVLAAAVGRLWPDVASNAVDPGWVPTKMGGAGAPDDLRLGHLTQEWLATSDDPEALTTGGYWHHQKRRKPHHAVGDVRFQDDLLEALKRRTGTGLI
jgi:NAD(P)-dependent dehydrogenase (short-subunit alcohol dehydrogenase family)